MKKTIDSLAQYRLPLYLVALAIFVLASMLTRTFYAPYVAPYIGKVILLSWGILAIIELQFFIAEGYSVREIIGAIFVGTMFLIVMRWGGSAAEFASFLPFAFVARNIEFKRIAVFLAYWQGAILLLVMMSAYFGVIENYQEFNYTETGLINEGIRMCYCIGFLDHLFPGYYMLNVTILCLFVWQRNIKNKQALALLVANSFIFLVAHGRYSYLYALISIMAIWSLNIGWPYAVKSFAKKISALVVLTVPMAMFSSFLIAYLYDDTNLWWNNINSKIGDRIIYASIGLKEWGISLFGRRIEMIGGGLTTEGLEPSGTYNWIDNAWMNMLFRYGIIFTLGFMVLFMLTLYIVWKRKQYKTLILFMIIICWMMLDDNSILLSSDGFLMMLAVMFLHNIQGENQQTKCKSEK